MTSMDNEPLVFTNYKSTLYQCFADMFQNKELSDAILLCENHRIHVHKFLLSASSSFFNNMYKKPNKNILHITNVKYDDLLLVLEFIYKGQVALHPDKLNSFLDATNKLSVSIGCGKDALIQKQSKNSKLAIQSQDCNSNIGVKNCDEIITNTKNSKPLEVSNTTEKHNLFKEASSSKIPGVIEVSREEFLKRMFKAHALPWPGEEVNQIPSVSTSSVLPSTSSAKPSTSTQSTQLNQTQTTQKSMKNVHSVSTDILIKPKNRSSKIEPDSKFETLRLIKERKANINGLMNLIKKLQKIGNSQTKIDLHQRELEQHQKALVRLMKMLPQPPK